VLVRAGENGEAYEAAMSLGEEAKRVELLAQDFAAKMPEPEFTPAELLSFLMKYRQSPGEAIDDVEAGVTWIREEKKKAKNEV